LKISIIGTGSGFVKFQTKQARCYIHETKTDLHDGKIVAIPSGVGKMSRCISVTNW
jgi:hypothetical protein